MYILFKLLLMNNKQATIAATTGAATLGAEVLVGGLGIGLLGTAVAVPASLVVATVGTIAFFAAGDDAQQSSVRHHYLSNDEMTYKFTVEKSGTWGNTCHKSTFDTDYKAGTYVFYSNVQNMRDFYKSLLNQGYQPA